MRPKVPKRIKSIKKWRDDKAIELDLDPAIVCTKALISAISVDMPRPMTTLKAIEGLRNWQIKEFGKEILGVLDTVR